MEIATITTQGRFTIPAEIRRKYDIKPGTSIVFEQKGQTVLMRPITSSYIKSIQGILKVKSGEKPWTQELIQEDAAEVAQDSTQ